MYVITKQTDDILIAIPRYARRTCYMQ